MIILDFVRYLLQNKPVHTPLEPINSSGQLQVGPTNNNYCGKSPKRCIHPKDGKQTWSHADPDMTTTDFYIKSRVSSFNTSLTWLFLHRKRSKQKLPYYVSSYLTANTVLFSKFQFENKHLNIAPLCFRFLCLQLGLEPVHLLVVYLFVGPDTEGTGKQILCRDRYCSTFISVNKI